MFNKCCKVDIIIIGAGLSGLTLALEILKKTDKTLIILEKKKKLIKDKNWCFWNYPKNYFTNDYSKKWDYIRVNFGNQTIKKNDSKFCYLNISSKKFYDKASAIITKSERAKIIFNQNISRIIEKSSSVNVKSNGTTYTSKLMFSSIPKQNKKNKLLQHFYGIEVEYSKNVFNKDEVTLMDMNNNTEEFQFIYVLPFSKKKALVESTYFSKKTHEISKYKNDIKQYLNNKYKNFSYKKVFSEYGELPMYLEKNDSHSQKIIPIGLPGNWIKISSGYCFQNAFKNSEYIVDCINKNKKIIVKKKKINLFLDEIFCVFLENYPKKTRDLFLKFFKKLSLKNIVNFLTENQSLIELFKILLILPKKNLFLSFLILLKQKIKNVC